MLVWAHHMFTVGLGWGLQSFFMIMTMLVAVPTGVKILNWLATTWRGNLIFDTPMLFALGFIAIFTLGGLTGIYLAAFPVDWQVHDTYFVVAHFHYVMFGGSVFAIFAALHYWWPKMFGRMLNEDLGKATFWLMFISSTHLLPQHLLGLMGIRAGCTRTTTAALGDLQPDLDDRRQRDGDQGADLLSTLPIEEGGGRGTTRSSATRWNGSRLAAAARELHGPLPASPARGRCATCGCG
jgi:cbb3-type cytochrome oxidase subunit 1